MPKFLNTEDYYSIDDSQYRMYRQMVHQKYPEVSLERFEYAKSIMPGQIYMKYILDNLQEATMAVAYGYNHKKQIEYLTFRTSDIENLLRAMTFMCTHMHDDLPEHNYDYIKSKSSTFMSNLFYKVKDNIEKD